MRLVVFGASTSVVLAALAGCNSATPRAAVSNTAAPELADDRELEWDRAVGWELRIQFPPGVTTVKRDELAYIKLDYASIDNLEVFQLILTARTPLRDKSLIARPEQLCHPNLLAAVSRERPDRLLLLVDGNPTPAQVDCLVALPAAELYLSLCPDDGTTIWQCDGDAQLTALATRPELVPRVRGLGIGFGDRSSWDAIARYTALEYLAIRGPAYGNAERVDVLKVCMLPVLAHLDVLDASRATEVFEQAECVFGRRSFFGWSLPRDPPSRGQCALRRLLVYQLDAARRRELEAACPDLHEIEVARP